MKDSHFARLFEVGDYQLLLTIEEDEDNDEHEIVVSRTEINGIAISVKIGQESFDAREYLASFTEAQAVKAVESAKSLCDRVRAHG